MPEIASARRRGDELSRRKGRISCRKSPVGNARGDATVGKNFLSQAQVMAVSSFLSWV
jgi:hypothetical protein